MLKINFNEQAKTTILFVNKETNHDTNLNQLLTNELFKFDSGSFYNNLDTNNEGLIYISYHEEGDLESLRTLGYSVGNLLQNRKVTSAAIDFNNITSNDNALAFLEGIYHSTYYFDFYKKDKTTVYLNTLSLLKTTLSESDIVELSNVLNATFTARNYVNMRANDLYPESYANLIKSLFKDSKVKVTVYNKEEIQDLNMNAFLAVSLGSDKAPQLVKLEYFNDDKTDSHITFVGKGVTYDSGGYAIKQAPGMASMNSDMAGSAAVVGAIKAIADNNLNVNVVGVMALTENLIDGSAFKNGDIISSMKGLTIEIGNTDAEGRLTLADAIYYSATKLKSTQIIELSTLTGACIVALGSKITGVVTKDDDLYNKVHKAGTKTGEFNWRLPITKELSNLVKGSVGDLKNSIPGGAGAITAGIFLTNFSEDVPYIHLDIAGPSYGSPHLYYREGASGTGVRTLYHFIKENY